MGHILGLRRQSAMRKLKLLGKDLFNDKGLPCNFDSNISSYIAMLENTDTGYANRVTIGIAEIKNAGYLKFVPDNDFARIVLNMYHEQCHCIQKNYVFRLDNMDDLSEKQLIQEIACRENPDYYKNDGNYSINASEIQAEQYGILHTYDYLCESFPDVDAKYHESILVDIVNEKMRNFTYFVNTPIQFTSLQDIEDAFDKAYDESFIKNRIYFVENRKSKDVVKKYMQTHDDAKTVYLNSETSFEKDKCIAAVNLKLHPDWLSTYPVLQNIDLSYENVIEKPYQIMANKKTPEQIREEQINQMLHGNRPVIQSRTQSSQSSPVKQQSSREVSLDRLMRKIDYSDDLESNHERDGLS